MRYHGRVVRPPSEADSYILQVTFGCSHNRCTFCGTYPDKPFRTRRMDEVLEDVALAGERYPHTRRVFLADGNALVLSGGRLAGVLDALAERFPLLRRVGIYANARDLLDKSDADLAMLTLMLVPGTELYRQWQSGEFQLMEPEDLLAELHRVITHLEDLSRCIFRTNHASNYLPLAGTLSRDKARLLTAIDQALAQGRSGFRPEPWRAL